MQVMNDDVSPTLREQMKHHEPIVCYPAVAYTVDMGGGKSSVCTYQEQSPTLACTHYGEPAVAYGVTTKGNGEEPITLDVYHLSASRGADLESQGL